MQYVCKYTPVELLKGFDIETELLDFTVHDYELSDQYIHSNICSFSRSIIEGRLRESSKPIILTTCCDSVERVADVLKDLGQEVFTLNLPHNNNCCGVLLYKDELLRLIDFLENKLNKMFDIDKFYDSFNSNLDEIKGPYISIMGARMNLDLLELIKKESPLHIINNTCTGIRRVRRPPKSSNIDEIMTWYVNSLLSQIPCIRMSDISRRRDLVEDPNLCGIIFNTVSFCNFYTYEYSKLKSTLNIPILRIETDYTLNAFEQIRTRLNAFYENLMKKQRANEKKVSKIQSYYAGIDIGSTSTNVVIISNKKDIISFATVPTGAKVLESTEKALDEALSRGGIELKDIEKVVTTGYGRRRIDFREKDVTEITCHAKGAYFLNPRVRTVIDIGGQDSKVIRLDGRGNVVDFMMNDKCAAGTGRFIEMMAQSLQLSLEEMSILGLNWKEDINISSMCSVFAQSEVVSLIASEKKLEDIIHGINKSIASKIISMAKSQKLEKEYMMTGGVARNIGVVRAIEEKLGEKIIVPKEPDICGALGAALIASES